MNKALATAVLIGLCCCVVYNTNRRAIPAGDTYPSRYLPFAILKHGTFFMNPVASVTAQGRGYSAYWMITRPDNRIISTYPIVTPVLVTPLYVPALVYLEARGWTDARVDYVAKIMEKVVSSILAALSVSLLYLLLLRRTTPGNALLLAFAYAFGTTTWVVSSQALWQHGVAQVMVIVVLLLLTGPYSTGRAVAVGLLCGLVAANRPPDIFIAAALGVAALFWTGFRARVLLAITAALPMLLVLFYNLKVAGNVAGGYGVIGKATFFDESLLGGIGGMLFSPARGLFVFSPFLLFLAAAWRHLPKEREERVLTLILSAGVVLQLLLYAKGDWRGGLSWGPRYFSDAMPFLIWMLVPVLGVLRAVGRACFLFAVAVSVAIEAIGAFAYSGSIDLPIFAPAPNKMEGAWNWRNAPFVASWKKGIAPAGWGAEPRGSFDAVESAGRAASTITVGQQVVASGWALAGDTAPQRVAIVIAGQLGGQTTTFLDRPDVRAALGGTSRAGWQIPIDMSLLPRGEHTLTAFVYPSGAGEGYFLAERKLMVRREGFGTGEREPDLDDSFRTAVEHLHRRQQADGSWLTAYTGGAQFQDLRPEMNTYTTALLIDLLDPVGVSAGLQDDLRRGREHLTRQIERGGLVRYHGRPDGPGIGTLGCRITPDTDDTALAWRIAPRQDRSELPAALATIARYRTPDGLYRTWLAPREAYECLDPGRDPNPADLTIQLHLFQLLVEARPAAGRALCDALRPVVDEDRVWVYYRKAPLVPILRANDVRNAGCEVSLPESRMRTEVPGQEVWVSMARMLISREAPDAVLARAILRELARDDFALIRANPPLLYHNDLTATVSRYYWSEDAGYALWLRLYDRYQRG